MKNREKLFHEWDRYILQDNQQVHRCSVLGLSLIYLGSTGSHIELEDAEEREKYDEHHQCAIPCASRLTLQKP